jgi:maltose alpha-D-glucosyltransferase/alpha-amylase
MLQAFVPNQGTAWDAMRSDGGAASIALANTLGRRTGELHEALASAADDPAFAPEPCSRGDLDALARNMRTFGARQLDLLRHTRRGSDLTPLARQVLDRADAILTRFDALRGVSQPGSRIRCHGDYHLGQTLVADGDVVILDFEGEPARTLAERREKSSPLRDVAGMLRSFAYAAEMSGRGPSWEQAVASAFLDGYRAATDHAEFLPDARGFGTLLDAFVLDKTLYELGYELNNRPDWVGLPLSALARVTAAV